MQPIYQISTRISNNGDLYIKNLPFDKGTDIIVKVIPKNEITHEEFSKRMQALIDRCSKNSPYNGLSENEIIETLRRQREEMYAR